MNVGGECHLNEHCILQTQKVSCVVAKSTESVGGLLMNKGCVNAE